MALQEDNGLNHFSSGNFVVGAPWLMVNQIQFRNTEEPTTSPAVTLEPEIVVIEEIQTIQELPVVAKEVESSFELTPESKVFDLIVEPPIDLFPEAVAEPVIEVEPAQEYPEFKIHLGESQNVGVGEWIFRAVRKLVKRITAFFQKYL